MKIVVVGATSAIAEHCCRLWLAEGPAELIMIVRDLAKAEKIAADLRVRGPGSTISIVKGEFHDPAGIAALVQQAAASGPIDIALIQTSLPLLMINSKLLIIRWFDTPVKRICLSSSRCLM